jgi:hypothetical protein
MSSSPGRSQSRRCRSAAQKVIERGAAPVREGRIVLDQKAALDDSGGNPLSVIRDRLTTDNWPLQQ